MAFDLIITNGSNKMSPCVLDGVEVEWERQGSPGKMTFTVLKDAGLSFVEGNTVTLSVDGIPVFYGFVVRKSRGKDHQIEVTCLDQLFYLAQNKAVYVIDPSGMLSSSLARVIMDIMDMTGATHDWGDVKKIRDNDAHNLPKKRFDSPTSYLDILQTAFDLELATSGRMFVLYDDFGVLSFKNIDDMKYNEDGEALLVTVDNAEDFDYESNIEESYNAVSIWIKDDSNNLQEGAYVQDKKNQGIWGQLTYFDVIDVKSNETTSDEKTKQQDLQQAKAKAKLQAQQLLELHNQVKRSLSINGVFCDPRIRGGSSVLVDLNLGDVVVRRWFMVESVTHHFKNDYSTMDLKLKSSGGFTL